MPVTNMPKPWIEMLPEFEGRVNHMYLDASGTVICGVGCALFSPQEAVTRFARASAAEEWKAVAAMQHGMPVEWYAQRTKLRMSDFLIEAALDVTTNWVRVMLSARVPESDQWPGGVREACLDLAYDAFGFARLLPAIRGYDYIDAAALSYRPAASAIRNDWTRDSILSALPEAS